MTLPDGWRGDHERGIVVARGPRDGATRIDLVAALRDEYGVARTAEGVLQDIVAQARALPDARVQAPAIASSLGDLAGARADWTYREGGALRTRRHWAVELASHVVHVSCVNVTARDCDRVAASLEGAQ